MVPHHLWLLRRHVSDGSEVEPDLVGIVLGSRDPESTILARPSPINSIRRLDVPVDDAMVVGFGEAWATWVAMSNSFLVFTGLVRSSSSGSRPRRRPSRPDLAFIGLADVVDDADVLMVSAEPPCLVDEALLGVWIPGEFWEEQGYRAVDFRSWAMGDIIPRRRVLESCSEKPSTNEDGHVVPQEGIGRYSAFKRVKLRI
jgi:hypothetical protein